MNKMKVKNIFAAVSTKSILDPLLAVLDPKQVRFWGTEGTVKYLRSKGFRAISAVSGFDFDGRVKSLDRKIFARILADRTNKKHLAELRNVILEGSASWRRPIRELVSRKLEIGSLLKEILSLRPPLAWLRSRMTREGEFGPLDLGLSRDHLRGGRLALRSLGEAGMDSSKVEDFEPFDLVVVDLYKPDPKIFPESMDIGGQALIRAAVKNYKNVSVAFDKGSISDLLSNLNKNNGSTTLAFRKRQAVEALKFIADRCNLEANLEP